MKVKELLSDESKWCKGADARDGDGQTVTPERPEAVSWCLMGAVFKCYPDITERVEIHRRIRTSKMYTLGDGISGWNDSPTTTFRDVKELVESLDI